MKPVIYLEPTEDETCWRLRVTWRAHLIVVLYLIATLVPWFLLLLAAVLVARCA